MSRSIMAKVPILEEDRQQYKAFVEQQIKALRCLEFDRNIILWHYTTGDAFLSIISSGSLWATQVSCLNDSTEIRYGEHLLEDAFLNLKLESATDPDGDHLLKKIRSGALGNPTLPSHAPRGWFVSCFSAKRDDLSQWRAYSGGENGYSIGFVARGLFGQGLLVHVNYDGEQHKKIAEEVAHATMRFFLDGKRNERSGSIEEWADEFLMEWSNWIDILAPMVKDPAFSSEDEYRIVHGFQAEEIGRLRFRQKATLMSRHLPLVFSSTEGGKCPMLPISQVLIGPGRHKEITRISVETLMRQCEYTPVLVSLSTVPYQVT